MPNQGQDFVDVYVSLRNFRSPDKILDFQDFTICMVRKGTPAADWRKRLSCKHVPEWILHKKYVNYENHEDHLAGSDTIQTDLDQILLLFRLFRTGDIVFADSLVRSSANLGGSINKYSLDMPSELKYKFEAASIPTFNAFRSRTCKTPGFGNRFFEFSIRHFMSGVDKGFFYNRLINEKIVDYVIALESLFLADNRMYFLRGTLAERICQFINNPAIASVVKKVYDERSNIVHGNNLDLSESSRKAKIRLLRQIMPSFEDTIRNVYLRLFETSLSSRDDLVSFISKLYTPLEEAFQIMNVAKSHADKVVRTAKAGRTTKKE